MVESAHFRKLHHRSEFWRLCRPRDRRIFLQGKASRSCRAVHSAVGFAVTAKWIGRRRSCERITKTNKRRNVIVGTTKKSAETKSCIWFFRKVRHVCEGGFRCWTIYFATVACETWIPSFINSP